MKTTELTVILAGCEGSRPAHVPPCSKTKPIRPMKQTSDIFSFVDEFLSIVPSGLSDGLQKHTVTNVKQQPDISVEFVPRATCFKQWLTIAPHRIRYVCTKSVLVLSATSKYWYFLRMCLEQYRSELRVLQQVYGERIFSPRAFTLEQLWSFLDEMLKWPYEKFISYAKYHCAAPLAYYHCNDLPPRPDGFPDGTTSFLVWKGPVKHFLKARLGHRGHPKWSTRILVANLNASKKGAAVVPRDFVKEELQGHRTLMSIEPPIFVPPAVPLDRLLGNRPLNRGRVLEPSRKACFENGINDGGAYNHILKQIPSKNGLRHVPTTRPHCDTEYYDVSYELVRHMAQKTFCLDCSCKCDCDVSDKTNHGKCPDRCSCPVEDGEQSHICPFRCPYSDLEVAYGPHTEFGQVSVVPICEPLKVRVITKGEAISYYMARWTQIAIKDAVNQNPAFVLTTEKLTVDHIRVLRERQISFDKQHSLSDTYGPRKWVSVDYKGATDRLNLSTTKWIFERWMEILGLEADERFVMRRVIYEQQLHYPKWTGIPSVKQTNGQLMGSLLSFPILCVANLLTYIAAFQDCYGYVPADLNSLPVLVNGDDMLFYADDELYTCWLKHSQKLGFILSVGKNLVHEEFCTINSRAFTVNFSTGTVIEVPILNIGLMFGKKKTANGCEVQDDKPIWDIHNEMISGAPDKVQASNLFIHYHLDTITKLTNRGLLNLFLPIHLGGLGFDHPTGDFELTVYQRRLASWYYHRQTLLRPFRRLPTIKFVGEAKERIKADFNQGLEVLLPRYGPYPRWAYAADEYPAPNVPCISLHVPSSPKYVGLRYRKKFDVPIVCDEVLKSWDWKIKKLECFLPWDGGVVNLHHCMFTLPRHVFEPVADYDFVEKTVVSRNEVTQVWERVSRSVTDHRHMAGNLSL